MGCLGAEVDDPPADMHFIPQLRPGDVLMACSDGLWHYFSPSEMGSVLSALSPREASRIADREGPLARPWRRRQHVARRSSSWSRCRRKLSRAGAARTEPAEGRRGWHRRRRRRARLGLRSALRSSRSARCCSRLLAACCLVGSAFAPAPRRAAVPPWPAPRHGRAACRRTGAAARPLRRRLARGWPHARPRAARVPAALQRAARASLGLLLRCVRLALSRACRAPLGGPALALDVVDRRSPGASVSLSRLAAAARGCRCRQSSTANFL